MTHVSKIIEVVGTSETSIEDAIRGAVDRASQSLDNLQWFKVTDVRGAIAGNQISKFQVVMKIGFGLAEAD